MLDYIILLLMHAWIPIRNKQKTYLHYALPINAEEKQLQIFVIFLQKKSKSTYKVLLGISQIT